MAARGRAHEEGGRGRQTGPLLAAAVASLLISRGGCGACLRALPGRLSVGCPATHGGRGGDWLARGVLLLLALGKRRHGGVEAKSSGLGRFQWRRRRLAFPLFPSDGERYKKRGWLL